NGVEYAAMIAGGVGTGILAGLTLGTTVAVASTGAALATAGEIFGGTAIASGTVATGTAATAKAADAIANNGGGLRAVSNLIDLGQREFGIGGNLSADVYRAGNGLILRDVITTFSQGAQGVGQLRSAVQEVVELANAQGATQVTFQGVFVNADLAARFGTQ